MIKRIVLRNIASFKEEVFDDLQKVNIIYGGNGTGKTTTGRVLAYSYVQRGCENEAGLVLANSLKHPKCEVYWDGKPSMVLAYNQDFRERYLKETMPGVFTLGEWKKSQDLSMLKEAIEKTECKLRDTLWKVVYRPNKDNEKALKGYKRKAAFAERIITILKDMYVIDDLGKAEKSLWQDMAKRSKAIVEERQKEVDGLKAALHDLEIINDQIDGYAITWNDLNSINETLRLHGFTGFKIQPAPGNEGGFQIQREDGRYVEDTLSEGEATIITFLYFMLLVDISIRSDKSARPKVVVIDDPISSLDYAAIDLVSTQTNNLIKRARKGKQEACGWVEQVIVLTHNATFLKSLSVNQPRKNTKYWKLYKSGGVSRVADCDKNNPARSYYSELWMQLREGHSRIGLPNIMRRIIETYFLAYGGLDRKRLLAEEYVKVQETKEVMKSNAEWLHGLYKEKKKNYYNDLEDYSRKSYMSEFRMFFKLMGQEEHYNMMMREV